MLLNLLLFIQMANADTATVHRIAALNGYAPSKAVKQAISIASKAYNVPTSIMTAIAIQETGIGKFTTKRLNKNGTYDKGLFQINTVNKQFCAEFNLYTNEGSAFCAAKLLSSLRKTRPHDYYAAYHSKTPSHKENYKNKIDKILKVGYAIKTAKGGK